MCEVPEEVRTSSTGALLPQDGLADAITPDQVFAKIVCCKDRLLQNFHATMVMRWEP